MALAVGTKAPDFNVKDTNGNVVTLAGLAGKQVVMYFYPKDDTPGCTKQACSFRDNYSVYQDKGIVILGVSKDSESDHQAFTEKFDLPFPLLADTTGSLIAAYDVDGGGYAKRVTYAIDGTGNIVHVDASVKTDTHATDILKALGY
ncbi:peroxiredoxin [Chamaesiphon sp.]|uniref:peroxiredoxin n=1 Tax=Chamaesiphon sp. TaxID=2814140 RepID=UPI003593F708